MLGTILMYTIAVLIGALVVITTVAMGRIE
jgi:hypothetical protein